MFKYIYMGELPQNMNSLYALENISMVFETPFKMFLHNFNQEELLKK